MDNLIVVTRPNPHGAELCGLLAQAGKPTIHCPTINITSLTDSAAFTQGLANLEDVDWLIFISPQSVYITVPTLRHAWPNLPPQLRFAALGPSTAKALQAAGYQVAAVPVAKWDSENLLALPVFQMVQGQTIAIVCGADGRTLLEETLRTRGAQVIKLTAYRRDMPTSINQHLLDAVDVNSIKAIICASFACVENLQKLCQQSWNKLQRIPLIVPSERVSRLAHQLGFQTIWVANNASHTAMLTILNERCGHLTVKETK